MAQDEKLFKVIFRGCLIVLGSIVIYAAYTGDWRNAVILSAVLAFLAWPIKKAE